jgi:hypothetical protein
MTQKKQEQFLMIAIKDFILLSNKLKPREVVLFLHYKAMADWDIRHKNYNTVGKTLREIRTEKLSSWSVAKICDSRQILIDKGLLIPIDRSRVRLNEPKILYPELNVQQPEQVVQDDGQSRINKIKEDIKNIVKKWHIS